MSSPVSAVLYGDSGFLVQAYGAVVLQVAPQSVTHVYTRPVEPAVTAAPTISELTPLEHVDYSV
jgi:hypothetical protein